MIKNTILTFLLCIGAEVGFAQSIIGKYSESAIIAPDKVKKKMQNDVTVTRDKEMSKKIWISNLIGNATFYAIRNASNEDKEIYDIPSQTVAGYVVNIGCVVFDREEEQIAIAFNNKSNCAGMSRSDYGTVSVGKEGVNAAGIKIGSNGSISAGGTKVSKKDVHVNAGEALSGLQYLGVKM